jgi:signal transduction histidine kinase
VLKAGADDFIVKGRFARLVPAIERETQNARLRRSYREGQTKQESLAQNLNLVSAELERFLYTAFHELRSPLVTIKGFLGVLVQDMQANRPERVASDIERISHAVDKMNELLSGLLKLSQIGRVSYPYEVVDLQAVTRETALRLRDQLRSANADIRIAPDLPAVYGDPTRLQQVLDILIENAIVHSGDQYPPLVEVGARARDGEHVIFVKDNGRGIDPRYHTRIFNLFEKLDLATEGTGIGLAIVKRIVEIHGGRVWVESEGENKGSTFYFTLPADRGA